MPDPGIADPIWPKLKPILTERVGTHIELSCHVPTAMTGIPRIEVILEMTRKAFALSERMGKGPQT